MSTTMEEEIKRWTARRKSALVMEILQGKTPVVEASRQFDLSGASWSAGLGRRCGRGRMGSWPRRSRPRPGGCGSGRRGQGRLYWPLSRLEKEIA